MKNLFYEVSSDFLAKLRLPSNDHLPYWCSTLKEKVLIFSQGEILEVDRSKEEEESIKIVFKKCIYITPEEYEMFFRDKLKGTDLSTSEFVGDITDLG